METSVVFERSNVAVSADPLGTVAGVQLMAVFQSPEEGLRSHVALPARANPAKRSVRPQPITDATSLFVKRNSGFAVLGSVEWHMGSSFFARQFIA